MEENFIFGLEGNAFPPNDLNDFGNVMLVKSLQFANASLLIVSTLSGITTDVNPLE